MKKFPKKIFVFGGAYALLVPAVAWAAGIAQKYDQLYNPLPQDQLFCPTAACDLVQMLLLILKDFLELIPIASALFIIIGGFKMIMSQGNQEKLLEAKRTIYWAVAGLAIALLSFSIIAIIRNLLGATTYG